jgi:hypothetical protein
MARHGKETRPLSFALLIQGDQFLFHLSLVARIADSSSTKVVNYSSKWRLVRREDEIYLNETRSLRITREQSTRRAYSPGAGFACLPHKM